MRACTECGKLFEPIREDHVTCGGKCSKKRDNRNRYAMLKEKSKRSDEYENLYTKLKQEYAKLKNDANEQGYLLKVSAERERLLEIKVEELQQEIKSLSFVNTRSQ